MKELPEQYRSKGLVEHFNRHLVPIYFDMGTGSDRIQFVISAFVFSVDDNWLFMTAGHVIRDIEKIRKAGRELVQCKLIDCMGTGSVDKTLVPFDYDGAFPSHFFDDETYDYGALLIRENTRDLLIANGVSAFSERDWHRPHMPVEMYRILGIPEERVVATPDHVKLNVMLYTIDPLTDRPDGFPKTDAPMFYGKIRLGDSVSELRGMSGAPIFAIAKVDGEVRYWLHSMQVSWIKSDQTISAMLMQPFGELLSRFVAAGRGTSENTD